MQPWRELLARARSWRVSGAEKRQIYLQSVRWATCAVGEHRERLETLGYQFDAQGCPIQDAYSVVYRLGCDFNLALAEKRYADAEGILTAIEHLPPIKTGV